MTVFGSATQVVEYEENIGPLRALLEAFVECCIRDLGGHAGVTRLAEGGEVRNTADVRVRKYLQAIPPERRLQRRDVSLLVGTGLLTAGLPPVRPAASLRWVIDSKDVFFRCLRLLPSGLGDTCAAAWAAQDGSGQGTWRSASDDAPILEDMVRAFGRGGDQLRAIERLITRLEANDGSDTDPIPAEFRALWNTFRIALATEEAAHDR